MADTITNQWNVVTAQNYKRRKCREAETVQILAYLQVFFYKVHILKVSFSCVFLDFCNLSAWLRCCMYRRVFKNSNYPWKSSFEDAAFFYKSRTLQKERSKTSICIEWHILVKIDKNFQWTLHTSAIIALKDTYQSILFAKSCTNKHSKSILMYFTVKWEF